MKTYRCPADETTSGDPFYGPGNYAGNNLVFGKRSRIPHDFPKGTSGTILFAEKYAACSYWALAEGREVPWYVPSESSGFQIRPLECDPSLPQSPHRGCIQVSMGDGSVRSVDSSTSAAVWYGMNTIARDPALDD